MIHMIHMIHTHSIVGHMFGHSPRQMWENTNAFVTHGRYGR